MGSTYLEAAHGEEEVGVVARVDADKGVVPVKSGQGPGQPVLHVPEHSPAQVHVVLHQAHARVPRPALLVVVAHDVLIVGVGVLSQVALDQVLGFFGCESEQHVDLVDVAGKQPDGVPGLCACVSEGQELIGHLHVKLA